MRRVVVFSVFLNVGSVLVIAKTLTYVAVRVPLLGLIKGLSLRLLKPYQTGLKKNFSSESIKEPEPKNTLRSCFVKYFLQSALALPEKLLHERS